MDISKIIDIIKDPDLKIKINDLYRENIELKEENYNLRRKIDKSNKTTQIQNSLVFENNHYYSKGDLKKEFPYCTKCWDSDNKLIRLHKGNFNSGIQYYSCPNCDQGTSIGNFIHEPHDPGGTHW